MEKKSIRIGQGFDVHRFEDTYVIKNRPLVLMGCVIPYDRYLVGHSDADVMLHSLIDALLGAVGLGDIGQHFPDIDPIYLDADSICLLEVVMAKVKLMGWYVVNADICLIGEYPKIGSYYEIMRNRVAVTLGIDPHDINIKATTTEQLGFLGRGEGLASQAVVLLQKI